MSIEFQTTSNFPKGTLYSILTDAYAFDSRYEQMDKASWQNFDDFLFDNAEIGNSCCFVTVLDGEPIGFASWDPRRLPELVEIGHNCIRTAHKGKGYGKLQLQEALQRIARTGAQKIIVTTDAELVAAQHMYKSVGFSMRRTWKGERGRHIDFEMVLK